MWLPYGEPAACQTQSLNLRARFICAARAALSTVYRSVLLPLDVLESERTFSSTGQTLHCSRTGAADKCRLGSRCFTRPVSSNVKRVLKWSLTCLPTTNKGCMGSDRFAVPRTV